MIGRILMPLAALLALAACGGGQASGSQTAVAAPPPVTTAHTPPSVAPIAVEPTPALPVITVADLDALARRAFPGDYPAGCGRLADCPVTDRLRARLVEMSRPQPNRPGPLVQFCRCQNGASSMSVRSEVTEAGGIAHVVLDYGVSGNGVSGKKQRIDLIIVRAPNSRLLIDDTQITGCGQSTSVYAPESVGCTG